MSRIRKSFTTREEYQLKYLLLVALVVISSSSLADYQYIDMRCDDEAGEVEFVPHDSHIEKQKYGMVQDCDFSDGRTFRAKITKGRTYPYGEGGATPHLWLSVWADRKKVLSRALFQCAGEWACSIRIVVNQSGLRVCRRDLNGLLLESDNQAITEQECEFITADNFPKERDSVEYPLANQKKPPRVGSLATLYANDKQFCSLFNKLDKPYNRTSRNSASWIAPPEGSKVIHPNGYPLVHYPNTSYSFDINNDGKNESVIGYHSRNHYRDADVYLVYEQSSLVDIEALVNDKIHKLHPYTKFAKRIIPHFWAGEAGAIEKELIEEDKDRGAYTMKMAAAPWWRDYDTPKFRFRYWYLLPFRYENTTYFLTWSQEQSKHHWYAILRPEKDYKVTEMCAFQIVQENS